MKPPPFDYVAAQSVDHAVELLGSGPDARVLAGGQSLLPMLNLRLAAPELVIDIGRLPELQTIEIDDGTLVIGSGVTQADAGTDPRVRDGWPLLAAAIATIGHPPIRNRGTVCGSLAHNDPLAELPAVAVALDAEVVARSPAGERTIAAADLFTGPFETALASDELLVAARFPARPAEGWSFREFSTRHGDFATAGVACWLAVAGGEIAEARFVLFGVGGSPARAATIEAELVGASGPQLAAGLRDRLAATLDPPDDAHASAATRLDLAATLVAEAIAEAWERAR